jgi:FlaA1/EpsC-like NDP-sugar epimerase
MSRQQWLLVIGLVAADVVMLTAALVLSLVLRYESAFWPQTSSGLTGFTAFFVALTLIVLLLSFAGNRLYDLDLLFSGHQEYAAVVKAGSYAIGLILILAFLADEPVSRGALLLFWLLAMPFVIVGRFLIRRLVFKLRESGRLVRNWLIVGGGAHAAAVAKQLNWPASAGIRVVGFLDDYRPVGSRVTDGLRVLGDPSAVREVVRARGVSTPC